MSLRHSALLVLALAVLPVAAYAQDCPETVDGKSLADLIAEQGGAQAFYEYTLAGIVWYEVLLEDLEEQLDENGPDPEIEAEIADMRSGLKSEQRIAEAALCHAGG